MKYPHEETHTIQLTLYEISYLAEGVQRLSESYRNEDLPWHADMLKKLGHSLLNVANKVYGWPLHDDCEDVEVQHE